MSTTRPVQPERTAGDRCPGAVRLHEAADGYLARIRLPGGVLTAEQTDALADAADTLGDGDISLTARGNAEIRGLRAPDAGEQLAAALTAAGLLPSATHERVRNIVASPTAGLDGLGSGSLVEAVRRTDRLLCDTPRAAALSGRFLLGLDDGRGDVLALQPDITARWAGEHHVEIVLAGTPVLLLPADQAPEALVAASVAFLDARDAASASGWRLSEMTAPAAIVAAIVDALVRSFRHALPMTESVTTDDTGQQLTVGAPPAPGRLGRSAAHLVLRLGTASSATWRAMAAAGRHGDGLVRTTPWRSVLLGDLPVADRDDLLAQAWRLGLIVDGEDPAVGVSACTGLPGCASSARDVRSDVTRALAAVGATRRDATSRLPVHVSGCDRRCGHPRRPHHEAVARSTTGTDGPYATGRAGGEPATGAPLPAGRSTLTDLIAPTHPHPAPEDER